MKKRVVATRLFLVLFAFWMALSGRTDPLFLAMGIASAAFVTALTYDLVADSLGVEPWRWRLARRTWRFAVYLSWMVSRIVVASVQIAYYIIHPRASLEPRVLRFRCGLRSPVARVMLANSITLVPGTLTLRVEGEEFTVHVLVRDSADDLLNARMQNMVGRVFLEQREPAPTPVWEPAGQVAR